MATILPRTTDGNIFSKRLFSAISRKWFDVVLSSIKWTSNCRGHNFVQYKKRKNMEGHGHWWKALTGIGYCFAPA